MTPHFRDSLVALAATALAVAYLIATFDIRHVDIVDPLGPKAFPMLVGFAMLACGVALGAKVLLQYISVVATPKAEDEEAATTARPVAVTLVGLWLLAYYAVFEHLGFVISTFLFLLGMTSYFHRGKWVVNVAVAIGFPVILDLVFSYVLGRSPAPGLLSF